MGLTTKTASNSFWVIGLWKQRGRFETWPYNYPVYFVSELSYAFPASFNPLSTLSELSGSFEIRTPVAL